MNDPYERMLVDLLASFGAWTGERDGMAPGFSPARMRQELHPYTHLFSPVRVNRITPVTSAG